MRPVPAHPASTSTQGHNPGTADAPGAPPAPLVTDLSLDDLERDARHAIGEMAYAYYAGGADDERLLEGNVAAWGHWQLHPRVLAGICGGLDGDDPARDAGELAGGGGADGHSGAGPPRGGGGHGPGGGRGRARC